MEYIIRGGIVYDPLNGINGEKMDIAVKGGKIVESVSSGAKVIDASGMIVLPGGVDLHSHIAGSKVNAGRIMRPEDHYRDVVVKAGLTRSGVGYSIPSVFTTGYRYAEMGYTTVFEPATTPLKTRHTHDELADIPIIDKGCFPLFGNNWFVMEYLSRGEIDEAAAYVAWTLEATKGYAIKVVNPGGGERWGWGGSIKSIDDPVPHFNITPREIVRGLCQINKMLNLPHPIHVHPNGLGKPGSYETTIETMDCVRDFSDGRPAIHLTHIQFEGYTGTNWLNIGSGGDEIAKYVNGNPHVSVDLGQIVFSDTTTMTADAPFEYQLYLITGNKWTNADVEAEETAGVVPYVYRRSNYVNAVQWAVGLEVALLAKDPWRVFLTTDHPNAGVFTEYPRVISWLMSKKAREKVLSKVPRNARRRTMIAGIDREYTLSEIAILTRAGTAKILGLKNKGHLGEGADGDIAVYSLNPERIDPSTDYRIVRRAFRHAKYVLKDGELVVNDEKVVRVVEGRTYWVKPKVPKDLYESVISDLRSKFDNYYTVKMSNYFISEDYIGRSAPIYTGGD
ncbi:MAG: formylmethanofuran dehydrogenase subunit A [Candidatus Bathyarchaeia archaeon]